MRALTAAAALVFAPEMALAHTVIPGVDGFAGGLLHPLLVPAHGLALIALGLLAGQQEPPVRRATLAIFAAGLLAGIGAIVAAIAVEDADVVVLSCAAVAGLLVALSHPLPVVVAGTAAAITGVATALDSVPQEISMQATMLALLGTFITAVLTLVLAAWLTAGRPRQWERIGIRILGSWIAASAILVLALRLVR